METTAGRLKAAPLKHQVTGGVRFVQWWLGLGATLFMAFPYLRRAPGWNQLNAGRRYLYVCNHVSLLDTILLGALCWRAGCYPILVLGDKHVWHASWIRRMLSSKIGFLLERGKMNPNRIPELEEFGRAGKEFHLIVFPEGTRGDGIHVRTCQPGIFHIAQAAKLPLVPVYFENMQCISTKTGPLHLIRGWRKVVVHFGPVIEPEEYWPMPREAFTEFVREKIVAARTDHPGPNRGA